MILISEMIRHRNQKSQYCQTCLMFVHEKTLRCSTLPTKPRVAGAIGRYHFMGEVALRLVTSASIPLPTHLILTRS
jgi:hypothetical protein